MTKSSRSTLLCLAYVGLHLLTHHLAAWFEVSGGAVAVSIWYAPAGLALAMLVIMGPRYAGVVWLANVLGALSTGASPAAWGTWVFPSLITGGFALTAWAVRRWSGTRLLPGSLRESVVFFGAILGSPLLLALVSSGVAWAGTPEAGTGWDFLIAVVRWWIGDVSGLLTVVPVVMVFVAPWWDGQGKVPWPPAGSLARRVVTVVSCVLLVGSVAAVLLVPILREHHAFFLGFLPLVWICMIHGMPGAVLATLMVTMTGLVGLRLTGSSADYAYVFFLFEIAVAGVGLGLGALVTRRQQAEAELATSRSQLNRVIDGAQAGLWEWDAQTSQVTSNSRLTSLLGYDEEAVGPLRERWSELAHPQDLATEQAKLQEHLAGHTPLYEVEMRMRTRAGQWHWILARGSVSQWDAAGRPVRLSGLTLDINQRKRAEAEIARLFRIIEATPESVFTTDVKGEVLYANAAMQRRWGEPVGGGSWEGRKLEEVLGADLAGSLRREVVPEVVTTGLWQAERNVALPDGRELPALLLVLGHRDDEMDTNILSFIVRDLSAQRQAEADRLKHERELMRVQKNESLGVLAGGIAHDFNNLMMSVVGSANLARLDLPENTEVSKCIDTIEKTAVRASALCQQMLTYAGRNPVEFAEVDLNQVVEETLRLVKPSVSAKVQLAADLAKDLPRVLVAPTQAQQVLLNLVLNGAGAIGDQSGDVCVRTFARRFGASELDVFQLEGEAKLAPGTYVCIEVKDTGCGMSGEVRQRIFEPFYTTKFTGSGLGLAVVKGFVRAHHAGIRVESAVGQGATFQVLLPVRAAEEAEAASPTSTPRTGTWLAEGTVLLVDDDGALRRVLELMLRKMGFDVILAIDGVEGVERFRERSTELFCVLLDITMPRMDGIEAHAMMNEINPEVPVVLISGYSQKLANLPPQSIHPAGVLAKPFTFTSLRERLREVLEARELA
ncbi:ATP-binding protein [Actomonas aquatica]|uniref:histidine kinase n=1 Tax=Actomonas aquatica TaxID=2866162 RepID=A0ABZ1CF80_9BACT|nr:ATP-binding protein [Opitutus sp. WL0086]WRQ90062.1 ATP-binding protein [Opitutus sp. WL0086]